MTAAIGRLVLLPFSCRYESSPRFLAPRERLRLQGIPDCARLTALPFSPHILTHMELTGNAFSAPRVAFELATLLRSVNTLHKPPHSAAKFFVDACKPLPGTTTTTLPLLIVRHLCAGHIVGKYNRLLNILVHTFEPSFLLPLNGEREVCNPLAPVAFTDAKGNPPTLHILYHSLDRL